MKRQPVAVHSGSHMRHHLISATSYHVHLAKDISARRRRTCHTYTHITSIGSLCLYLVHGVLSTRQSSHNRPVLTVIAHLHTSFQRFLYPVKLHSFHGLRTSEVYLHPLIASSVTHPCATKTGSCEELRGKRASLKAGHKLEHRPVGCTFHRQLKAESTKTKATVHRQSHHDITRREHLTLRLLVRIRMLHITRLLARQRLTFHGCHCMPLSRLASSVRSQYTNGIIAVRQLRVVSHVKSYAHTIGSEQRTRPLIIKICVGTINCIVRIHSSVNRPLTLTTRQQSVRRTDEKRRHGRTADNAVSNELRSQTEVER